jgi:asparagine synthase (glutamine-hydrolysing)
MCGIAGFFDCTGHWTGERKRQALGDMAASLRHRGPDGEGLWLNDRAEFGVAHRRLAVVDVSPTGAQPMVSHSGRFVLSFNGEIYNHRALRKSLESAGVQFKGTSDTEVLLASIEEHGLVEALQACVGMFALALWDRREHCLTLARDRVGEKPLYYGVRDGTFLFASELKALAEFPGWTGEVDSKVVGQYLRQGYVPAPWSIYRSIYKLLPATTLTITREQLLGRVEVSPWADENGAGSCRPIPYWSAAKLHRSRCDTDRVFTDAEAISELESLLTASIRDQMIADVPVGAMLSGGIDSSTVVAVMQSISARRVHTFSIGFNDPAYNEADSAAAIAAHLGTEHTELYVSPRDAMNIIPGLATIYDEPFADVSQIPTLIVARLARDSVTVSLSGDGGDELFGGYVRYAWAKRIWSATHWLPAPARHALAASLTSVSPVRWDDITRALAPLLPGRWRQVQMGDKLHKTANVLGYHSREDLYRLLTAFWADVPRGRLVNQEAQSWLDHEMSGPSGQDFAADMMFWDTISYLPDDILVKLDRATMAVSLEGRVPLLDHRVVEFAMGLTRDMKVRDGQGKWILRQVLNRYVPRDLTDRPKMGFGVPIGDWLRGPLRDWAEDLLDANRLREAGFLDPDIVRVAWSEHLGGRRNWQYRLWNVLMFQAWYAKAMETSDGRSGAHGAGLVGVA